MPESHTWTNRSCRPEGDRASRVLFRTATAAPGIRATFFFSYKGGRQLGLGFTAVSDKEKNSLGKPLLSPEPSSPREMLEEASGRVAGRRRRLPLGPTKTHSVRVTFFIYIYIYFFFLQSAKQASPFLFRHWQAHARVRQDTPHVFMCALRAKRQTQWDC